MEKSPFGRTLLLGILEFSNLPLLLPGRGPGLGAGARVPRRHERHQRLGVSRDPGPLTLHDRECPQEDGNVVPDTKLNL